MILALVPWPEIVRFVAERAAQGEAWRVCSDIGHHTRYSVLMEKTEP